MLISRLLQLDAFRYIRYKVLLNSGPFKRFKKSHSILITCLRKTVLHWYSGGIRCVVSPYTSVNFFIFLKRRPGGGLPLLFAFPPSRHSHSYTKRIHYGSAYRSSRIGATRLCALGMFRL